MVMRISILLIVLDLGMAFPLASGSLAIGTDSGGTLHTTDSTILRWEAEPTLSMNAAGDIVVAWSGSGSSENTGIFAQRYALTGERVGDRIKVNGSDTGSAGRPVIDMDRSGRFVIAWREGIIQNNLYFRRFNADGTSAGLPVLVDAGKETIREDGMSYNQGYSIALSDSGQIHLARVAATHHATTTADLHVKVFQFSDLAAKSGTEIYNGGSRSALPSHSSIAALPGGGSVLCFHILDPFSGCNSCNPIVLHSDILSVRKTIGNGFEPNLVVSDAGILAVAYSGKIQFFDLQGNPRPEGVMYTTGGHSPDGKVEAVSARTPQLASNNRGDVLAGVSYRDSVFADLFVDGKPHSNNVIAGTTTAGQFAISLTEAREAVVAYVEDRTVKIRFIDARKEPSAEGARGPESQRISYRLLGRTLQVQMISGTRVQVDLFDSRGTFLTRLLSGRQEQDLQAIPLSGHPRGVYFLRVREEEARSSIHQVTLVP